MGKETKIEWATATWNPWVGCIKVSDGCKFCYAERGTERWGKKFSNVRQTSTTFDAPKKWKDPERIFVCSYSDFFIEEADEWRVAAWNIMATNKRHTYMLLTKRPERILEHIPYAYEQNIELWKHIWIGVSVENQEQADKRIPHLLRVPAPVQFLSVEPMLGPICLDIPYEKFPDWVICGGESGPDARPMHPDWARSIRDQCQAAKVPFFFKQWGEWIESDCPDFIAGRRHTFPDKTQMVKFGKKRTGRYLDGKEWSELPSV